MYFCNVFTSCPQSHYVCRQPVRYSCLLGLTSLCDPHSLSRDWALGLAYDEKNAANMM